MNRAPVLPPAFMRGATVQRRPGESFADFQARQRADSAARTIAAKTADKIARASNRARKRSNTWPELDGLDDVFEDMSEAELIDYDELRAGRI